LSENKGSASGYRHHRRSDGGILFPRVAFGINVDLLQEGCFVLLKDEVKLLLSNVDKVVLPKDLVRGIADVDSVLERSLCLFNKALGTHVGCKEEEAVLVGADTDHIGFDTSTLLGATASVDSHV
jgi:hypothetical protein